MKWLFRITLVFVVLCIVSYAAQCLSIYITAIKSSDSPECAGKCIAITLGAAVWTNRPSPVFKERINEAISLYQTNKAQTLIFTGGLAQGDVISESLAAKNYAISQGIDPNHIIIEQNSSNTWENILYARNLLKDQSYDTLFIVSDPYHLHRALEYADAFQLKAQGVSTQTSLYQSFSAKTKFLLKEAYLLWSHETAKMIIATANLSN